MYFHGIHLPDAKRRKEGQSRGSEESKCVLYYLSTRDIRQMQAEEGGLLPVLVKAQGLGFRESERGRGGVTPIPKLQLYYLGFIISAKCVVAHAWNPSTWGGWS